MSDTVVVVQARMGSRRLPAKSLAALGGRPMVLHVLERAAWIGEPVILATTDRADDDGLADMAQREGWAVTRGDTEDVLDRFATSVPPAARYVVRITADCPLLDPAIGRAVLASLRGSGADYVSNTLVPTFPDGLDVEAFTVDALLLAWRETTLPSDREHVTPLLTRDERFLRLNLSHVPDLSGHRWTVDDLDDLTFVRRLEERLRDFEIPARFAMRSVLSVLEAEPTLRDQAPAARRNEGYRRSMARD